MSRITVCLIAVPALVLATNAVLAQAEQIEAGFCQITDAEQVAKRAGMQDPLPGIRLLANHQEVEAGDVMKARLANLSDATVFSGAAFKIQRHTSTGWQTDPSSPDGPWPLSAKKLKPGGVGRCYRYVVPEAQPPGRYRFLTSISARTEQYSKTYRKVAEFFIRDRAG